MRDQPPAPPHVPDYELLREIGRGSYGVVWLARSVTGLYRAVKIVWRGAFEDPQPYEREFRGIKQFAAISLVAPRQLALLHVGRNDDAGFFYYVMELADDAATGREIDPANYRPNTLKEVRARRGRLLAGETIALGVELAEGLAELHTHGLVHRDIKPSNIIFVGGAPKLADIGLVASTRTTSETLSRVGNPGYMPPDFPGVPSADVYGLGKVLYELVTGREREDYPRLPAELATFPDRKELLELNEILLRACTPDTTRRYVDASAFLEELRLLQAGKSVRRLRAAERHLSRALRAAAVLAIAAALGAGGAWVEHKRAAQAEAERDALARRSVYAATLARAQRAVETNDFGRAKRHLKAAASASETHPGLRHLEWDLLWQLAQGDPARVLSEQASPVERIVQAPGGGQLAIHRADKQVMLLDPSSGKELRRISGVHRLAGFSHDGSWLFGTDAQFRPTRWSVRGEHSESIPSTGVHRPICVAENDRLVCFVDGDQTRPHAVRMWEWTAASNSRRPIWETGALAGGRWDYFASAASSDGKTVALSLLNGRASAARWRLVVLSVDDGRVVWDEETPHRLATMAIDPAGRVVACGLTDIASVRLLDLVEKKWRWSTAEREFPASMLAIAGDEIIAGQPGGSLQFLSARDGRGVRALRGHEGAVTGIVALQGQRGIASASQHGDVRAWDAATPLTQGWEGYWAPAGGGRKVSFSPDGQWIAATRDAQSTRITRANGAPAVIDLSQSGHVVAFDGNERAWLLANDGTLSVVTSPAFSVREVRGRVPMAGPFATTRVADGAFAVGGLDGHVALVDAANASARWSHQVHRGYVWWCTASTDGRWIATSGEDGMLNILATSDGRRVAQWKLPAPASAGCFLPGTDRLVLALESGAIWNCPFEKPDAGTAWLTSSGRLRDIMSIDASRIVVSSEEGSLHVVDAHTGSELLVLPAAPEKSAATISADRVAVHPATRQLVIYMANGTLRRLTW